MASKHRHERDRRAEIRLLVDQERGQARQHAGNRQVRPGVGAAMLAEILRKDERHANLGKLRGLQVERTERDPAPRVHLDVAEEEYINQDTDKRQIDEVRLVREGPIVDCERDHQPDDPEPSAYICVTTRSLPRDTPPDVLYTRASPIVQSATMAATRAQSMW